MKLGGESSFGPSATLEVRFPPEHGRERRRGRAAGSASLLALAARGFPAMLGLAAPSKNSLRSLRSLRSNSFDESVHEARCARGPRALRSSAAQRRAAGCPPAPSPMQRGVCCRHATAVLERQAVPGGGDFWGDEKRRAGVGARSALRGLTRRNCLTAVSEANEGSFSARPRTEHRSGVGAQRRPLQHEPAPGTACRDARTAAKAERGQLRYATRPNHHTDIPAPSSASSAAAAANSAVISVSFFSSTSLVFSAW